MSKEFTKYNEIPQVTYSNPYECLGDNTAETRRFLRCRPKIERGRYNGEFAYIGRLRDNPNKFVIIRYNVMGLFVELLSSGTEIDIELKHDNKNVIPHISSALTKTIKEINKIQRGKNYLTVREFKSIVKKLRNTYYEVDQLNNYDNAHIFNFLKSIKNDEKVKGYIFVKEP